MSKELCKSLQYNIMPQPEKIIKMHLQDHFDAAWYFHMLHV